MKASCNISSSTLNRPMKVAHIQVANSFVGRTVSLMIDARNITRGFVAGVTLESGQPKIVVNGEAYDPHQVLSSWPAFLNV